jgi:hypothetical protein
VAVEAPICVLGQRGSSPQQAARGVEAVVPIALDPTPTGIKTNSPRPRPAGYRSVGNAITLVAATRLLLLVQSGHPEARCPIESGRPEASHRPIHDRTQEDWPAIPGELGPRTVSDTPYALFSQHRGYPDTRRGLRSRRA